MLIAIVGGGAAGMMAALAAAENKNTRVIILERQARVGRKLAVTGNGRCNLTNMNAAPECYNGKNADFCAAALAEFTPEKAREYFLSLGLITVEEPGGRVYPYSDSANSVVDVLRFACDAAGIETRTGARVTSIKRKAGGFTLSLEDSQLRADRVIVACGGMAGTKAGGVKDGYELLESLDHSVTALYPALVQLKTEEKWTRALKGVRAQAAVTALRNGRDVAFSAGEVQFTDYGVSGPAIFEISADASRKGTVLRLDLMSGIKTAELEKMIAQRIKAMPLITAGDLLTGMLHNRLGKTITGLCCDNLNTPLGELDKSLPGELAGKIKNLELTVTGDTGFDNAQVTRGGVRTEEFNPSTMESRLVPGLYAAGEVLDIDGMCGGYNLQWAWASGRAAGRAAAEC